jgi:CelD/BcsL family acetyltransferase involved in cellulose biosynthesis
MSDLVVDVVRPADLGPEEQATWTRFTAADPAYASPFFGLDYTLIAGAIAPGARVAIVRRRGDIVAFLPFQRRGAGLQPLGAPLTDYHGLIAAPGAQVDIGPVLQALRAQSYRFSGLVGGAPVSARAVERTRLAVEMPAGFAPWYAGQRGKWGKFFKDKERAGRSLERDHGAAEYRLHDDGPEVLDWIIAHKRAQYRLTGQHDVFACGWTGELLRALLEGRTARTGARIATMRLDGRLAAAEYSLRDGAHNHFWFPVYSPEYARYSCGTLLSLRTLELAAADGVTWGDYGLDAEGYKKYFAEPVGSVLEGVALARGAGMPARLDSDGALIRWRAKAERRLAVIVACETRWSRAAVAAGYAATSAALRRMRPTTA